MKDFLHDTPPSRNFRWTGLPAQGSLLARLPIPLLAEQWHSGLSFPLRLRGSGGIAPLFLTSIRI